MKDYLQNRKRKTKVGTAYSNWQDILAGVSQASFLRPILSCFLFLCDLFLEQGNNYFPNFTDDATLYVVDDNTTDVVSRLTKVTQKYLVC